MMAFWIFLQELGHPGLFQKTIVGRGGEGPKAGGGFGREP